jgi:hypothetical protein
VAILVPWETYRVIGARSGREYRAASRGARPYELLPTVLDHGRALRLFFPQIDTVCFIHEWTPDLADFDLFMVAPGEYLVGVGRGPDAQLRVAGGMMMNGWPDAARRHLASARLAYPDDASIAAALAVATRAADSAAAAAPRDSNAAPRPRD